MTAIGWTAVTAAAGASALTDGDELPGGGTGRRTERASVDRQGEVDRRDVGDVQPRQGLALGRACASSARISVVLYSRSFMSFTSSLGVVASESSR